MYESPIELSQRLNKQMDLDLENKIVSAVQEVGISVNKYELERALAYDRGQYDKGYKDGYDDALRQFVEFMKEMFGIYLVRSGEDIAELRKTHPDLFCIARKKED